MANFTIFEKAQQYHWKGDCFLSIKSFSGGNVNYNVGHRSYQINDQNYLLLNDCTNYELTIDSQTAITSFCIFFDAEYVSENLAYLTTSPAKQLDGLIKRPSGIDVVERLYPKTDQLTNLINRYQNAMTHGDSLQCEEYYQFILEAILVKTAKMHRQADTLNYIKPATKLEILKRIYYAKDYIDAHFTKQLTLNQIAAIAMMSPNQLLRNFKQIFGQTPFQYVTKLRIEKAKFLLMTSAKSVSEITYSLGYSSLSNFSHYFKTITGSSPSSFKKSDI